MAIYPPTPKFSGSDKRLLSLLEKLLLEEYDTKGDKSNVAENQIPLSDIEAISLAEHLQYYIETKEFNEAAHFIESLTSTDRANGVRAREIYLSARARKGRTRAMSSAHWESFYQRFSGWYRSDGRRDAPMSFSHFRRMEMKLLAAAGIGHEVAALIMLAIDAKQEEIELLRQQKNTLRDGSVREAIASFIPSLFPGWKKVGCREISVNKVISVMTVVADTSVLFTTRDWSITGTISTAAGALIGAVAAD